MRAKRGRPSAVARKARRLTVAALDGMGDKVPVVKGCADYTTAIVEALRGQGVPAVALLGSFDDEADQATHAIHFWIELPTGEWLDPTSEQFGLPRALVLPRGDVRRRFYGPVVVAKADHIDHLYHDLSVMLGTHPVRFHRGIALADPALRPELDRFLGRLRKVPVVSGTEGEEA